MSFVNIVEVGQKIQDALGPFIRGTNKDKHRSFQENGEMAGNIWTQDAVNDPSKNLLPSMATPYFPAVECRPGWTQTRTFADNVLAGKSIYSGRNNSYIATQTRIYQTSSDTAVHTGLTTSTIGDWTTFVTSDILVNGTEAVESTNGTSFSAMGTLALGTGPGGAQYVESYNNMLFAGGHDAGKIRWSELGDATDFPALNNWDFSHLGEPVQAITKWKDVLIVWFESVSYVLRGFDPDTIEVTRVLEYGLDGNQAYAKSRDFFYFTSGERMYRTADFATFEDISTFKFNTEAQVDHNGDSAPIMVWEEKNQRLFFEYDDSFRTNSDAAYYYYPALDAFFEATGQGYASYGFVSVTSDQDLEDFFLIGGTGMTAFRHTGADDNGTTITAVLWTPDIVFGPFRGAATVLLNSITLVLEGGDEDNATLDVAVYSDGDFTTKIANWDNQTIPANSTGEREKLSRLQFNVGENVESFQVRVSLDFAANQDFRIYQIGYEGEVVNA